MMKKFLKHTLIIVGVIVVVMTFLGYRFFYDMNHLPKGELIEVSQSPTQKYTIEAYRVNPHATVDYSIRCALIDHENQLINTDKNIYWGYKEYEVTIEWIDEEHVIINDKQLNVNKDRYDWRRQ